jgi:uncharacterized protein (TIGR02466 family)
MIDKLDLDLPNITQYCYSIKEIDPGVVNSNYGGWHSSNLEFNNASLQPLIFKIKNRVQKILESLNMNQRFKISNMWVNINQSNTFNLSHRHPFSLLSGVFYVDVKKNCGDLVFKNPNILHDSYITSADISIYNGFNSYLWKISPNENDLVIFPSWVEHYTEPNQSNCDRVSISFNIELI